MRRYWWANQGATQKLEVEGGYLWSPFREKRARSQFYDNMRRAEPGDLVLSYADGLLGSIGRVEDRAAPAPKPFEFGEVRNEWATTGWMLPVNWSPLSPPVELRGILPTLLPLLPAKYSPVVAITGRGNQKGYLSEVSRDVVELALGASGSMTIDEAFALPDGDERVIASKLDDGALRAILGSALLSDTERRLEVDARNGQGKFRQDVLKLSKACRLTGISDPRLLNASHIKPWRVCETAAQRLDGHNGIALTPNADRLFDRGLISFESNGQAVVSPRLDRSLLSGLGLSDLDRRVAAPFPERAHSYLEFHRNVVLLKS